MPGEITQVLLDDVKTRLSKVESRLETMDDVFKTIYRVEAKLDQLTKHTDSDDLAHRELQARVLKCETQLISVRAEILSQLTGLEKKMLRWAVVVAAASGGTGAGVLKMLSFLGAS